MVVNISPSPPKLPPSPPFIKQCQEIKRRRRRNTQASPLMVDTITLGPPSNNWVGEVLPVNPPDATVPPREDLDVRPRYLRPIQDLWNKEKIFCYLLSNHLCSWPLVTDGLHIWPILYIYSLNWPTRYSSALLSYFSLWKMFCLFSVITIPVRLIQNHFYKKIYELSL